MILRFDPKTKKTTVFTDDSGKSNGLMFDARGNLIACEGSDGGGRCVSRWDVKTGKREIDRRPLQGKRFNACNDLCIDEKGRIYFTDPRYLGTETRELEHRAVYRIDTDGKVVEVTHDVEKPNGIAISPDQKTLYVADHNNGTDRIDPTAPQPKLGAMKVYAFPLGSDGLVDGPRRTLIDFGDEEGSDGMTVDIEGNIYLAARAPSRPGVLVIEPDGKEVGFIPTGPLADRRSKELTGQPQQRRLRHRRREQRALHHRRQEPVPHPAQREGLPHPLGPMRRSLPFHLLPAGEGAPKGRMRVFASAIGLPPEDEAHVARR